MSGEVTWSRFVWRHLDQAGAAALWDELTDWVQWLRERYQLGSQIPACWFRHGPVVEELTALMSAHTAAYQQLYTVKSAPLRDWDLMIAWHRGELAPAIGRISKALSDCASGTHQTFVVKAPLHDGLDDFIAADITGRLEATATAAEPARGGDSEVDFDALDDAETVDAATMGEHVDAGLAVLDDDGRGADFDNRHWTYDSDGQVFTADE